MLDAGHGGYEPGAIYNGRQEKDDNLALTLALGNQLEENGYEVVYTRTTDMYESPFEKAMEANASGADLFISIHRNAFPTPNTASGVESLVYDKTGIKYEIAEAIDQKLAEVGFVDLGVKERPNLVVLKRTNMPAVLVEVGFIDSDDDNALFDEKFDEIAKAIADGIIEVVEGKMPGNSGNRYQVQVGLYRNKAYADELLTELLQNRYPAYMEYQNDEYYKEGYYAVKVGNYFNIEEALNQPEKYADLLSDLERRVSRVEKRRQDEKRHQKNLKQGKK